MSTWKIFPKGDLFPLEKPVGISIYKKGWVNVSHGQGMSQMSLKNGHKRKILIPNNYV